MIVGITSVFVYVYVSICVCSCMLYMIYIYMSMYMYVGIFMSLYLCVCSVSMCVGIRITFVNRFTLSQWVLGSYSDVQVCVDSIFICGYKSLIYYLFDFNFITWKPFFILSSLEVNAVSASVFPGDFQNGFISATSDIILYLKYYFSSLCC